MPLQFAGAFFHEVSSVRFFIYSGVAPSAVIIYSSLLAAVWGLKIRFIYGSGCPSEHPEQLDIRNIPSSWIAGAFFLMSALSFLLSIRCSLP